MQITSFCNAQFAVAQPALQLVSAAAFVEGLQESFGPRLSHTNIHTGISVAITDQILFAVRNPRTYNGLTSQVQIQLTSLAISSSKSSNNTKSTTTVSICFVGDPSNTLYYNYIVNPQANSDAIRISPIYYANPTVNATDGGTHPVTLNNATKLISLSIPSEGSDQIDLTPQNILIPKNTTIYVIYSMPAPSGGDVDVQASLSWTEGH